MKNKLLLFGYVFAASFGAFVVGLNLGGISGALEFITAEFGLSAMAMGLVTSAIMIGCLIGALLGGRYSDKYGRRNMMIISAVMLILSAVGCAMASNAAWLIAARFLGGCGMGVLSAVIPIYISEISPAKWRGTFVSFYQLFIVIGILAAYCADFGMISWGNNWRWMLGLPLLFAAGNLLMLLFLPESPRWLIKQGEYGLPEKPSPAWEFLPKMRQLCLKHRNLRRRAGPNYPSYSADRRHTSSCWARCSPYSSKSPELTLSSITPLKYCGRPVSAEIRHLCRPFMSE